MTRPHPTARAFGLPTLTATGILLAAVVGAAAGETSVRTPKAPPSLAVAEDEEACQFAILADNNIGEDVWILFGESSVYVDRVNLFSYRFDGMSNRRLAPGEKLNVRYEAPGSCGASRAWHIVVRIGPRGGERIRVFRDTEDRNDRTVHLGESACWATAERSGNKEVDRYISFDEDPFGCDPSTTQYGLAPEPDSGDPGGRAGDDPPGGDVASVSISSLQGNWRRFDSNNDRNDGMRALVEGSEATILYLPESGSRRFQEGMLLWQDLSSDGSLRVRGSDGRYYTARLSFEGEDRIHIDIDSNGLGNDQTWDRAGPMIEGEWVLAASTDGENEGLRIEVQQDRASLRYLPASASVPVRVGDILWREIGSETLEALTGSRDYATSGYRLAAGDQLRVETGGVIQVWVRPGAEDAVDTSDLPAGGGGGDDPAGSTACVSTGLVGEVLRVNWGWGLTESDPDPGSILSALPAWESIPPRSRRVIDLDRSRVEGLDDHYALIWEANTGGLDWEEERDLTGSAFMDRNEAHRNAGLRLTDIEVDVVDGQPMLAGIWTENVEGIDWDLDPVVDANAVDGIIEVRAAEGYRLVDIEAHERGGQTALSLVWHRSCAGAEWDYVAGEDRDIYQDRLNDAIARGLQPIDIESWPTPAGQRYAAIFETPGAERDFRARSGRNLQWFINYHRRYVDQGFRLIDYESYETADGTRYGGIWVENDERWGDPIRPVLDTLVENYRVAADVPGMSVVVIDDGEVVYRRGFGVADRATSHWAWSGSVYLTASVSKVVGATLATRLEEKLGDFDLSRPTADYLGPALDYIRDDVSSDVVCRNIDALVGGSWEPWMCATLPDEHTHTVEQLLSKTGCVPHYQDTTSTGAGIDYTPPIQYYRWRAEPLKEMWESYDGLLPGCVPGQHYRYSSAGFTLLGAVLESQTGKDIATLIEEEISGPLGLSTLRAMDTPSGRRPDYDRVTPFVLTQTATMSVPGADTLRLRADPTTNPSIVTSYGNSSWKVLGGGIESDAMDLARFGWATLNDEIVSRPTRMWSSRTTGTTQLLSTSDPPSVGLAWEVDGQFVDHGGSWVGARSYLSLATNTGISVAILSNRRNQKIVRFMTGGGHALRGIANLAEDIMDTVLAR